MFVCLFVCLFVSTTVCVSAAAQVAEVVYSAAQVIDLHIAVNISSIPVFSFA